MGGVWPSPVRSWPNSCGVRLLGHLQLDAAATSTNDVHARAGQRERGVRVTRALTDGTMERTRPDGKKETVQWKAGDVKYSPKDTFLNKNVGKTEVVLYTVTLK